MRDGWGRKTLKALARARYEFDLGFTRFMLSLAGEPRYELRGRCTRCGACCTTPMIQTVPSLLRFKSWRLLVLGWHRHINGFEYLEEDRKAGIVSFRCTHYNPQTRLCDAYDSRPGLCRDYPTPLLFDASPEMLPECGYYAVDKGAKALRDELKRLSLPPEKLEALLQKLNVAEVQASVDEGANASDVPLEQTELTIPETPLPEKERRGRD